MWTDLVPAAIVSISIYRYREVPNKSPFDTKYTGRSGNNETGLFVYDIYLTRKLKIGIHGENQMIQAYIEHVYCEFLFIWIHMATSCYVHMDKVWTEC